VTYKTKSNNIKLLKGVYQTMREIKKS